jgi:adenylyltransferase/sulfurtransferase
MLSDAEKRRYHRHILLPGIGEEGQSSLKNARVMVVGAGGLGAPILQYLTAAGVGHIAIMDFDTVNEDNLHRQILYGGHDLGKLKTIIAKQKLNSLNPFVKHDILNIRLTAGNALKFIAEFDMVIDATDNFSTRYLINDACLILNKPWIYGSVYKFEGQVTCFNYKGGPTLRCLFPDTADHENVADPVEVGLLGALPGLIGTMQAVEAIKIITGAGEGLSGKLLQYNMMKNEYTLVEFPLLSRSREITRLQEQY